MSGGRKVTWCIAWCIVWRMRESAKREARHALALAAAKRDALLEGLHRWGSDRRSLDEQRDPLVLASLGVGITKEVIHQATGLGRSTLDRIEKENR